jgi:two-component system phosphate regulon response regulator PhoB
VATVLVIEDEWVLGQVLEQVLGAAGHDVVIARSLAAARDRLRAGGVDLVLLDVVLPDGSGLEFLQELRGELGVRVPVLILSGMKQEDTVVRGLELGADDYVTKPFSPRELLARIRRWTRG